MGGDSVDLLAVTQVFAPSRVKVNLGRRPSPATALPHSRWVASGRGYPHAFEQLGRALDERDPLTVMLKVDPALEPLRPDPRFAALVKTMGLPA